MAVTEFALLTCSEGTFSDALRDLFKRSGSIQKAWCVDHLPDSPSDTSERGTWVYQQLEDPSIILLCAVWPDIGKHWEWINSPENQGVMKDVSQHIVMEGEKQPVLLHVEGNLFASPEDPAATPLLSSPVISFGRFFISAEKKVLYEEKHAQLRYIVEDYVKPFVGRSAWRVDKEVGAKDEFVPICGWESIERHKAFGQTPDFAKYSELLGFIDEADVKHYHKVL